MLHFGGNNKKIFWRGGIVPLGRGLVPSPGGERGHPSPHVTPLAPKRLDCPLSLLLNWSLATPLVICVGSRCQALNVLGAKVPFPLTILVAHAWVRRAPLYTHTHIVYIHKSFKERAAQSIMARIRSSLSLSRARTRMCVCVRIYRPIGWTAVHRVVIICKPSIGVYDVGFVVTCKATLKS